ncbi:GOLPH3/VPS74 family protein [Cerasicoccus maritimus]|uniref:GOLPH3/VPS74 family protein n=1 Tax=Cerasicoccus maritimus TaxID=490089 RepID=UPI0028528B38|nr:GPP34 family phosphoprotein [Cerasicoccus maritimus]
MTFAEQLLVLALDPKTGKFHALPRKSLEIGLAGAFLLEMTFRKIIDSDAEKIIVLQEAYPQRPLLNSALQVVREGDKEIPLRKAVGRLALQGNLLVSKTLESLVHEEILEKKDKIFFIKNRKAPIYPQADERMRADVIEQVRELVLNPDEIPSPEETALLALVEACRLQRKIFTEEERDEFEERFQQLASMDLVGIAIVDAVRAARDKELLDLAAE